MGYCLIWYLNKRQCASDFVSGNFFQYLFYSVLFAMVAGILTKLAPEASGSGIAEIKVILSHARLKNVLSLKTLFIKAFALTCSVGSGLMLGKEGPLVHISVALQSLFLKKIDIPTLSAAASAGVSCAFGTPIGGVLFSFEEVSYNFDPEIMWKCTISALISLVTLQLLNPYGTGKSVIFKVDYVNSYNVYEICLYILIGILGGLFGKYFIKFNLKLAPFRKPLVDHVVWLSLLTSILSWPMELTYINNSELIQQLFQPCHKELELCQDDLLFQNMLALFTSAVIKFVLMVVTFGTFCPAGIFIPSMTIGAICGRLVGLITSHFFEVNPGLYALIGAAAFLSGTTRMTLSLVVIMYELTNTPYFAVPVMITILCSKYIAGSYSPGIYDVLIKYKKYLYLPILENIDDKSSLMKSATESVSKIMHPVEKMTRIHENMKMSDILQMEESDYFVVRDSLLLGYLDKSSFIQLISEHKHIRQARVVCKGQITQHQHGVPLIGAELDISQYLQQVFSFNENTPISACCHIFQKMDLEIASICKSGQLMGQINKEILVNYFQN
eukprot:NODE_105_length_19280_cov_0.929461.p4 type:complete len:557 gc:universal NODE_105_length_19280_cov_0.929461:2533-4203(+)